MLIYTADGARYCLSLRLVLWAKLTWGLKWYDTRTGTTTATLPLRWCLVRGMDYPHVDTSAGADAARSLTAVYYCSGYDTNRANDGVNGNFEKNAKQKRIHRKGHDIPMQRGQNVALRGIVSFARRVHQRT